MARYCTNCFLVDYPHSGNVYGFANGYSDVPLHRLSSANILEDVEHERLFRQKPIIMRFIYFSCALYKRSDWRFSADFGPFSMVDCQKGVENVWKILELEIVVGTADWLCIMVYRSLLGGRTRLSQQLAVPSDD